MPASIQRNKLFVASCLGLLVTSLSFGIRAGVLGDQGTQFNLNSAQLGTIAATAFWGFPLAVIIGGFVVDVIGMKKLLIMAFVFHLAGIFLTIFATGYWTLFFSTLLIGIANGTIEAACNPLVTALYPDNKTTKLNHFHLWFPGGIFLGTLIVFFLSKLGVIWQLQVAIMLIPTLLYGYFFSKLDFPPTERVSSGISTSQMYKALLNPLFAVMIILMFGTAITELFTGQWIDVLLKNVTENALLLLTLETGIMVIGRAFAGPVVHKFSPPGVLIISSALAALGLYILGHSSGSMLFAGAIVFGMGVCYFWPTMLGFVSENLPRTGAVGLNLMGGAGMLAVSLYTIIMGGYYDKLIVAKLNTNIPIGAYSAPSATPEMISALTEAKKAAGPQIINATLIIPIILTAAFIGLFIYIRSRKKVSTQQPAPINVESYQL
ncbi:sugar MFS transporter [Ferruginibacter sp.]|uniref:MFS transporter n=1 Tax=Ferruginibacter sp. TaxID=1940288 RepID=UPI0019C7DA61|nr:MFS transporter [Ferruginibacter sp.]MBC7626732.1 MFS transporter [Ferruginibacter sp.]